MRLGRLQLFEREEIGGHLRRWVLIRDARSGRGLYLHHFYASDANRFMHDHPKAFWTVGLWGSYIEERPVTWVTRYRAAGTAGADLAGCVWEPAGWRRQYTHYHAPWVRGFPAGHPHRVLLTCDGRGRERGCWTLCLVGRTQRDWGFWTDAGWVDWRTFHERRADPDRARRERAAVAATVAYVAGALEDDRRGTP